MKDSVTITASQNQAGSLASNKVMRNFYYMLLPIFLLFALLTVSAVYATSDTQDKTE